MDPSFNFYLTGWTADPNIPTTAGAFQPTYNYYIVGNSNNYRAVVAKFSPVTGVATGAHLTYGTYLGGTGGPGPIQNDGQEQPAGIATDAEGDAYVTGYTNSYDFPITEGLTFDQANSNGNPVSFLTKINPSGSGLVWSTLVGTNNTSSIGPPRVDSQDNVYTTGLAYVGYPEVNPVQSVPPPGYGEAGLFVTEFNPTGSTLLFSTLIYSPSAGGGVNPAGVDVDSAGNIYFAGSTTAPDLPVTAGVFQPALNGAAGCTTSRSCLADGFIGKINPNANASSAPSISSISPSSATAGGAAFTLTIHGRNSPRPRQRTGYTALTTTYVSATELTAAVPASLIESAGTASITVTISGGTSAAATFAIYAGPVPALIISSLSPSSASAGGASFTLTVNGTNFVPNATVNWGSTALTTTFVGASQLTASVPASLIATVGVASVTVTTSAGTSNSLAFTVQGALLFVPMTPCRVADTRNATGPFGGPSITGETSRSFVIPSSACAVPSTAAAYSINVTVVPQAGLGYLTVWPTGVTQPVVSILNSDGRVKANAAIVPAGTSGAISVYATNTTDVVLDINGYFVPATSTSALAFYPLTPCRVADTRNATGSLGGPSLVGMQGSFFPNADECVQYTFECTSVFTELYGVAAGRTRVPECLSGRTSMAGGFDTKRLAEQPGGGERSNRSGGHGRSDQRVGLQQHGCGDRYQRVLCASRLGCGQSVAVYRNSLSRAGYAELKWFVQWNVAGQCNG